VALSGGRTPEALFRLLDAGLPWDRTDVFWVDERYVPHGHPESNFRMAKELLLDRVPVPAGNIHPMPTGSGDPARDAAAYEELLRKTLTDPKRTFDFTLLGLGEDGHTASLFPGGPELVERERWVAVSRSPKGIPDRLTLTVPALTRSALKVLLVCGQEKAAVLRRMVHEHAQPPALPAQYIKGAVVIADEAACSALKDRG